MTKTELLQEVIFFLIHLFVRDVLVMKKLEIEKTKHNFIISVLKVEHYDAGTITFHYIYSTQLPILRGPVKKM